MTAKKKITDKNGVQVFPITHTKAVFDDNGNSVEQRLQEQMDVINQKQLEVGAVPSDTVPTAGSTNWVTSGGVKAALDNKVNNDDVFESHSWDMSDEGDFSWILGTIHSDNGKAYYSSSYYHINVPVTAGLIIKLKANSNYETTYAFLKDTNFSYPSGGADITSHYVDGEVGVHTISAGNDEIFIIPDGCNYLYITTGQKTGIVQTPAENYYYTSKWEESIEELSEKVFPLVSLPAIFTNGYGINPNNGGLNSNAVYAYSDYIDVHLYDTLQIDVLNASSANGYALYDQSKQCISGDAGTGSSWSYTRTEIDASDAYYIRLTSVATTNSHFAQLGYPAVIVTDLPVTKSELGNMIKNDLETEDAGYILDARQGKKLFDFAKSGEYLLDTSAFSWTLGWITNTGTAHGDDSFHATQYSDYIELDKSFKKIVTAFLKGTTTRVGAFYDTNKNYIPNSYFGSSEATQNGYENGHVVDIPDNAVYVRLTRYTDTETYGQLQFGYTINGSNEVAGGNMSAVSLFRNAKVISQSNYKFAFCAHSFVFDDKLYVNYLANTSINGDNHSGNNVNMLDSYSLFDNSVTNTIQTVSGFEDSNGNLVDCTKICVGPTIVNDVITSYVQAWKPNVYNPYVGMIRASSTEGLIGGTVVVCNLSYNGNTVLFNMQNYRQMLADIGYASSYVAPEQASVDNNGICYYDGTYYMVFNSNSIHETKLPLVLLTSNDGITWSPISTIGDGVYAGSEISIAYKDAKLYIASRDETHGIDWFVFDLSDNTVVSSGRFGTWPICSRPYVFMFHTDVFMAVNFMPTWYGNFTGATRLTLDAREQVNIYKMVDDEPVLFRTVNNPEGINYHAWTPSPIVGTMYAQQSIYCAYSEDRRHLFRRQFGNVSVADVTALFVDFDKL